MKLIIVFVLGMLLTLSAVYALHDRDDLAALTIQVIANGRPVIINSTIDGARHCIVNPRGTMMTHNKFISMSMGCPGNNDEDDEPPAAPGRNL